MKVIYKAPGQTQEIREISKKLEDLQAAVGGRIETVTFSPDFVVIGNEESRLLDLPYNCTVFGVAFFGPILIVGSSGEEFTSLKPYIMSQLMQ